MAYIIEILAYDAVVPLSKSPDEGRGSGRGRVCTYVNADSRRRYRMLVRLAALLHDVGQAPFSHAAEELMPSVEGKDQRYKHEEYSSAIIRRYFKDVIESHKGNINYAFTVDEVAGLIEGGAAAGHRVFIAGQKRGVFGAIKRELRRRSAIEPVIGHMKAISAVAISRGPPATPPTPSSPPSATTSDASSPG